MGHNLNINNGRAAMMYVREAPWHKLGTRLENPATAGEAIQAAGLDFTVELKRVRTEDPSLAVEGRFATVRGDTLQVLGVVGSHYAPIQNKDAFAAFDVLVGEGEAIYHTAGALGKGERIWLLAKLPDYIRVNGNDIVEKYLLLTNTHDGTSAVRVKLTPIRVVCENTLTLALSGAEQEVRIRHTSDAQSRLREAHQILGLTNNLYAELDHIFNRMSEMDLKMPSLDEYLAQVFPDSSKDGFRSRVPQTREKVRELIETGRGAEVANRTLWGAYNAVTEYVDHYRIPKAGDSARLRSIWFGSGERIKKQAFKVAMSMLN